MRDSDVNLIKEIAREIEESPEMSHNAALCGARRISCDDASGGQVQAVQYVETENDSEPTLRQSRAAQMLATGMSIHEVAATLGIHRGTIFRWRQTSEPFLREQEKWSKRAAGDLKGIASRLLVKATGYIDRLMEENSDREVWAARILRNRRLWELVLESEEKPRP